LSAKRREIVVDAAGEPLDRAIHRGAPGLSRDDARALIESGKVFLDGKRCRHAARIVGAGARIVIHVGASEPSAAERAPPRILYEDADLIAVDKRPGEHVNETETSSAMSLVEQLRGAEAHVVHRLDRETSGVVVLAKGRRMAEALSRVFQERAASKTYLAIAAGMIDDQTIDLPIAIDKRRTRARCVSARGKPARTEVRTIARAGELSSLELHPITGRTHQIRVHLSHLGAPIAGDALYGGPMKVRMGDLEIALERVMLHARTLAIPVRGRTLTISAPIPEDMRRFADAGLPLERIFS
jgi:23S rRNA pseudouridine1911/1915/1917 synthase